MTPASKGSKKPVVLMSKVPSVRELCQLLGFPRTAMKETHVFVGTVHNWRETYVTSNGQPATQLLLWNQPSVQTELQSMAEKFLDHDRNGERFWSPGRAWSQVSGLQFPEDRERIVELIIQLFWKQNTQAFKNAQRGHKATESMDGSRDSATPSGQSVETIHVVSPPRPLAQQQIRRTGAAGPSTVTHSRDAKTSLNRPVVSDDDIYEIPDDPHDPDFRGSWSLAGSRRSPKHGRTERMGIEDSPHKRKKYSLTESTPRRTNRKRIPRDTGHQHLAGEELEVSLGDTDSELDDSTRGAEQAKGTVRAESAIKASPQSDPNSLWGPPRSSLNQTSPPTPAPSLARPPRIRFEAAPIFQNLRTSNTRTTPQPSTAQPPRPGSVSQIRPSHSPARDPAVESQVRLEDQPPVSNQALHAEILRKLSPKSQVILQDDETLRGIYFDLSPENQASLAETLEAINLPLGDDRTRSTLRSLALARISNSDLPEAEHSADPEAHAAVDSTSNAVDLAPQAQTTTPAPQPSTPPKNAAGDSPAHPQPSAEESHTPNPTNPEASSSKARPKTQVPLWIITREPRRIEERWSKGKFLGSTLSVFIEDISKVTQRNNIKEIILTLRTPFYDTKMTIFSDDDEDSWTSSKETFIEKLKEARAEAKARRMNESMNFKILVEPVYEQAVLPGGSVEEDDAEFEF